jgi:hypothetical protein
LFENFFPVVAMRTPPIPEEVKRAEPKRLWRDTWREYGPLDAAGTEYLRVAVISLDNYLDLTEKIRKTGPVYTSKGSSLVKKSPLYELARQERQGFLNAMAALALEPEAEPRRGPGRPSLRY